MQKSVTLLALLLCCATVVPAQTPYPKWEFGAAAGLTNYLGDTNKDFFPVAKESHLGAAAYVRYAFSPAWGLRVNGLYGRISGDDANFRQSAERGFRFAAQFYEGAALIEWDAHGKLRYGAEGFKPTLSTFFFAGPGVALFNPSTEYNSSPSRPNPVSDDADIQLDRQADKKRPVISAVLGAGFKYDYNEKTVLGIELGVRPAFSDLLDGISAAGDPENNDWYMFAGVSLGIRLVPADGDRDSDGIANSLDKCPDHVGPAQYNGCPDSDGDGLIDQIDDCPGQSGSTAFRGCPDTDGDKIGDSKDKCPREPGTVALQGCPDADGDGITDRDDECPALAGTAAYKGCPDTDNDGIPDSRDQCPAVAGPADRAGCPFMDSDADGVEDRLDQCPQAPGLADKSGCPAALSAADGTALQTAARAIAFRPNSSDLTAESLPQLDRVAELLQRYANLNATIDGHTDSDGAEAANLVLSERRAQACRDYLVTSRGIAAGRISARGFGESRPIADNKTADGKRQNRRIEIVLN